MTNETTGQNQQWAARAALDWADKKHAWALQAADTNCIEQGEIDATPEAVDAWSAQLAERFAGRPVAVVLEQSRGTLLAMLTKYSHLVLFSIHPGTAARYRQAFAPSGAKDDPPDARLLLDFLTHHQDRLRRWQPDTVETRTLQFLVEDRRMLVDDRTRLTHRLRARLKLYFPQFVQWFDDLASPLVRQFLRRWPQLTDVQKARPDTLRKFFRRSNCRSTERIEQLVASIAAARPATTDAAVLAGGAALVRALLDQIAATGLAIAQMDAQIAELYRHHEDASLYQSFPAAGPAMGPRLLVALGTDRDRYHTAADLQCYSGIAPVLQRSGQRCSVRVRRACPKFLRQTLHEWAGHTIGTCPWATAFYRQKRAAGNDHHAAVRALAYKWIRILFRCWKDRVPYDEARYELARSRRAAPRQPNVPTRFKWEQTSAGFSRFAGAN